MSSFPTQVIRGWSDCPEFKTPVRVCPHPALKPPRRKRIIVCPEIETVTISVICVNDYAVGGIIVRTDHPAMDYQGNAGFTI